MELLLFYCQLDESLMSFAPSLPNVYFFAFAFFFLSFSHFHPVDCDTVSRPRHNLNFSSHENLIHCVFV